MSRKVGIREAKAKLSHFIELARRGEDVVVTDRGTPVVRLVLVPSGEKSEEDVLTELAELGLADLAVKKAGVHAPVRGSRGRSISALVREMRR